MHEGDVYHTKFNGDIQIIRYSSKKDMHPGAHRQDGNHHAGAGHAPRRTAHLCRRLEKIGKFFMSGDNFRIIIRQTEFFFIAF